MPYFRAAGQRLEYAWFGDKSSNASTLVFLHEGLGSLSMWRDYPAAVADVLGCRALVYSRAGYGKSDHATFPRSLRFMHDEALIVLPEVLKHFEIQQPFLIGHSDGGSIALIYTGSNPSAVRGVVVEAPHVFTEELTVSSIAAALQQFQKGDFKQRLARHHSDVDHTFLSWSDVWLRPEFRSWNIEEFLPGMRCPLLVIQGKDDKYGTMQQVKAIQEKCGSSVETLWLPHCGHSPHRDQPEATLSATVRFIQNLMKPQRR
jgi:Predicted hydrolases or acyltransferases (alpha/beta hydrolase superfamily)